jgi:zinc/manganese transport system substrate-binding protein
MKLRRALAAALAPLALAVMAIDTANAAEPIPVVTSITILQDIVRNIGGDKVDVKTLVGPNGDAHVYQPTPADAKAISQAKLVVINGLGLEGWLPRLTEAAQFKGRIVTAATGIKTLTRDDEDAKPGSKPKRIVDPHAWQDLRNGQIYVANVTQALTEIDPGNAEFYRQSADLYRQKLADLDTRIRTDLGAIPAAKRRVISTHDAFQYYGKAYGVEFIAPVGVSTESEASAGDVAKLIRQIKQQNIKALFLENVSDPRLIQQLAKDTNAVVGPPLYSDALSKPDEPAGTYLKMFEYNTATLRQGMQLN